jgi:protein disulfide-isomerase
MNDASKMKVEIWSDIACPFCYIGKKNYEKAISEFARASDIELEWHSFQLDPTIPEEGDDGIDMASYLEQRKGMPKFKVEEMFANIRKIGKDADIEFNFDKAVIANTIHAHRLLQLAKTKGLSNEAEEVLFKAYFTDGKDIGSRETLKSLGLNIGLSEIDLDRVLNSDEFSYEVNQDIREAANIGVQGVPFFVFNRRYGVSGAQPVGVFLETIHKAFSEWKEQPNS